MASALADWTLIAAVIGGVIAIYFAIAAIVDDCIEYWRAYRDSGPPR